MELLVGCACKMVEEPFKLLIMDSVMANFKVGDEELGGWQLVAGRRGC